MVSVAENPASTVTAAVWTGFAMSSDDLHNRIKSDVAKWSQVIEKAGIKKR